MPRFRASLRRDAPRWVVLASFITAVLTGCDDPAPVFPDIGPNVCTSDAACDDGRFCNGSERCALGADGSNIFGCVAGTPPCTALETCDEVAQMCVGGCLDRDGDGFQDAACGGTDCDDADPTAYPGNTEVCDARGHDEDCDPTTLAGAEGDVDGDSYESAACCNAQADGSLACGDDCNDALSSVHPGVVDGCNLTDDDCDGAVDENPAQIFYRDLDGDGFGRPGDPDDLSTPESERAVRACGGAPGYSSLDTDCDDTVRGVNPAANEVCADGIDNNCDQIEDADPTQPTFSCDCTTFGETRACGGGTVNVAPALCRQGVQTCQIGGTWSGCLGEVPAQTEQCNGIDDNCDGVVDEATQVDCYADPDGDGLAGLGEAAVALCPAPGREAFGGCPVLYTNVEPTDTSNTDCGPFDREVRPGGEDICDGDDQDCDGRLDEAPNDAGCTGERGWGQCQIGRCRTLACAPLFGDCDLDGGNGCETDLRNTPAHCGRCGVRCPGGATCDDGVCTNLLTDIELGDQHGCALTPSAEVVCWGFPSFGQTGIATPQNVADDRMHRVPGVADALDLAVGPEHGCVVVRGGDVLCWGRNDALQVGGASSEHSAPVRVAGVTGASAVAAGGKHTCALSSGEVYCWGSNAAGQLGDSGVTGNSATAVLVRGLSGVVAIAAGDDHSCALLDDEGVYCWGDDTDGEIGNGAAAGGSTPSLVSGLRAKAIAAGLGYTCAIQTDDTVSCWGRGVEHQLGQGSMASADAPTPVAGLAGVTHLWTGGAGVCARLAAGTTSCWGDGSPVAATTPTAVPELAAIVDADVSASGGAYCGLSDDGIIFCWGANGISGSGIDRMEPHFVGAGLGMRTLDTTVSQLCGTTLSGRVLCINDPTFGSSTESVMPLAPAREVVAGGAHACALLTSGQVACWGATNWGQLGDGTETGTPSGPVLVSGIVDAVDIEAGVDFTCAVLADWTVRCWGRNELMQIGVASPSIVSTPVTVPGVADAIGVGLGMDHACAHTFRGELYCWGYNSEGQIGTTPTGGSIAPTLVLGLPEVTDVDGGAGHTCARTIQGDVYCWGLNASEQSGQSGFALTRFSSPMLVGDITNTTNLSLGVDTSCATIETGQFLCWGGDMRSFMPEAPPNVQGVLGLTVSQRYEAAIASSDGGVILWGDIGDGVPIAWP